MTNFLIVCALDIAFILAFSIPIQIILSNFVLSIASSTVLTLISYFEGDDDGTI